MIGNKQIQYISNCSTAENSFLQSNDESLVLCGVKRKITPLTYIVCKEGIVLGCDSRVIVYATTKYKEAGIYDDEEKFLLYKGYGVTCCGVLDVPLNNQYITWKDIVKNAIDTGKSFADTVDCIADTLAKYNMIKTQMIIANASTKRITRIESGVKIDVSFSAAHDYSYIEAYNFPNLEYFLKGISLEQQSIETLEKLTRFYINKNIDTCNLLLRINQQIPEIGGKARTLFLCFDGSYRIDGVPI